VTDFIGRSGCPSNLSRVLEKKELRTFVLTQPSGDQKKNERTAARGRLVSVRSLPELEGGGWKNIEKDRNGLGEQQVTWPTTETLTEPEARSPAFSFSDIKHDRKQH
jgi:hypothetical protein